MLNTKMGNFKTILNLFFFLIIIGIIFKSKAFLYQDKTVYDGFIKIIISALAIAASLYFNYTQNRIHHISIYPNRPVYTILLFLPFAITTAYFFAFINFEVFKLNSPFVIVLTLVAILFGAACEEFIFRLFAANYLLNRGFSIKATAIISSVFFAIAHITNLHNSDWVSITNQTILAFITGILMFCLTISYRNFLAAIAFHFFTNIPLGLNGLINTQDTGEYKITLLNVIGSILLIQVIYFPLTVMAVFFYKKLPKTETKTN